MDYLKNIKERQEKFLEKPRESIKNLINEEKEFSKGLVHLGIIQSRLDMILLFKEFHKQYSGLIGNMLKEGLISGNSFKDDLRDISVIQTIKNMEKSILNHKEKSVSLDEIMFSLKKSYASLLEIIWSKLKRVIFFAGINSNKKHLSLYEIGNQLKELEERYSIDLSLIKDMLSGKLRNCINHEGTYFESPNFLVFMEEMGGKWKEFYRINDEDLIEELLRLFLILTTFQHVETLVIISYLEPLLKLEDRQLEEYCKTGKLTKEMRDKIDS